jgi:hypothetical protein
MVRFIPGIVGQKIAAADSKFAETTHGRFVNRRDACRDDAGWLSLLARVDDALAEPSKVRGPVPTQPPIDRALDLRAGICSPRIAQRGLDAHLMRCVHEVAADMNFIRVTNDNDPPHDYESTTDRYA